MPPNDFPPADHDETAAAIGLIVLIVASVLIWGAIIYRFFWST